MTSELTFNVASGKLFGMVGEKYQVNTFAWSGGRGGTKTAGVENDLLINNPLLTSMKLKEKHGKYDYAGAIPMGDYTLFANTKKPNWIRLEPDKSNVMFKRDGFAIHGRGPRGSDGCIVPHDFETVTHLYDLTLALAKQKQVITLHVIAVGDIDYFINKIKFYNSIG